MRDLTYRDRPRISRCGRCPGRRRTCTPRARARRRRRSPCRESRARGLTRRHAGSEGGRREVVVAVAQDIDHVLPTRERPGAVGRNERTSRTSGSVQRRARTCVVAAARGSSQATPSAVAHAPLPIATARLAVTMRAQDDQSGAALPPRLPARPEPPRPLRAATSSPRRRSTRRPSMRRRSRRAVRRPAPSRAQPLRPRPAPRRPVRGSTECRDRGRKHGRREKHRRRCNARLLRRQIAPRGLGPGILRDRAALRSARTGAAGPKQQQERHRPNEPRHAARTISERPPSCAE